MDQGGIEAVLSQWRQTRRPDTLGELLKTQRDRAYAIALRMTSSPADAEDAVQDAFIKLMSRTHGFDNLEDFELSIYRAVLQCSLNIVRARRRRKTHEDEARNQQGETQVPYAEHHTMVGSVEENETRELLRTAMTNLSDDERAPVVLCYYQGLSLVQTAKTLALPRETVRARLQKTLGRLRQFLNAKGRDLSAATIVMLLWQDGSIQAPSALCAALDRVLPGKPCAQTPASPSHLGAAQTHALAPSALNSTAVTAAAVLLVSGLVAMIFCLSRPVAAPAAPMSPGAAAEEREHQTALAKIVALRESGSFSADAPRSQPGSVEVRKEGEVNSKMGAIILAGSILMPMAMGAEPNAQVNDVVAQIAARREAKDTATAQAMTKAPQGDSRLGLKK